MSCGKQYLSDLRGGFKIPGESLPLPNPTLGFRFLLLKFSIFKFSKCLFSLGNSDMPTKSLWDFMCDFQWSKCEISVENYICLISGADLFFFPHVLEKSPVFAPNPWIKLALKYEFSQQKYSQNTKVNLLFYSFGAINLYDSVGIFGKYEHFVRIYENWTFFSTKKMRILSTK